MKDLKTQPGWHTIPRVDKTPSVTGSWVDVDVSDVVPEGAKAVAVLFHVNAGWTYDEVKLYYGARKNGSSDEGTYVNLSAYHEDRYSSRLDIVELDENRIFEVNVSHSYIKVYIVGYLK
ncbi:MAG: hypothetical protein ACXQTS_01870 [Candidatus Methanospirareceae archaeon]